MMISSEICFATERNASTEVPQSAIVLWSLRNGPDIYVDLAKDTSVELGRAVEAAKLDASGWIYNEEYTRFVVTGEIRVKTNSEWQQFVLSDRSILVIEQNRWKRLRLPLVESIYDCYVESYKQMLDSKGDLSACALYLQKLLTQKGIRSKIRSPEKKSDNP
ncbi:hypothetical protein [Verrucomicrobium spinosum]|uniref:hypothetical protein n=1 Tax=Verrucomicrobium spinosum TaxID=2736 RepID=UPI0012E17FB2|nr:hypothetical protein [Verrucomicrobium spinosum]